MPLGVLPGGASVSRRFGRIAPLAETGSEATSHAILLGLSLLTVPAVAYSLTQLWSLLSGDTLTQAIRAFVP